MPGDINAGKIRFELTVDVKKLPVDLKTAEKDIKGVAKRLGATLKKTVIAPKMAIDDKGVKKSLKYWEERFKAFSTHIQNYLSFTIGVQIVMRSIRAMQEAIDLTSEFTKAVGLAAGVSGYLGESFDDAVKHIEKMSKLMATKTIYSALDVAKAYYSVASAGYDVFEVTDKQLIPVLNYAAAQGIDLDKAMETVIKTLKQFNLSFDDASRVVDTFTGAISSSFMTADRLSEALKYSGQIAGALGVPLEDTVAALASLVNAGYEGAQAGRRLNMILNRLIKPTEEGKKVIEGLGLTLADLDPRLHSITEILYTLKAAGFGAAEASAMFRAETAAAAITLVNAADNIAYFASELAMTQGLTEALAERQIRTLWGSLTSLASAIKNLYIDIGKEFEPVLVNIVDIIKSGILPAIKFFTKAINFFGGLFRGTGGVLKYIIAIFGTFYGTTLLVALALRGLKTPLREFIIHMKKGTSVTEQFRLALMGVPKATTYMVRKISGANVSMERMKILLGGLPAIMTAITLASMTLGDVMPDWIATSAIQLSGLLYLISLFTNELKKTLILFGSFGTALMVFSALANSLESTNVYLKITLSLLSSLLIVIGLAKTAWKGFKKELYPIFALLAALQILFSVFWKPLRHAFMEIGEKVLGMKTDIAKAKEAASSLIDKFYELRNVVQRMTDVAESIRDIRSAVNELKEEGELTTEIYEKLMNLTSSYSELQSKAASIIGEITKITASATDNLSSYMTTEENYIKTRREQNKLEEENKKLILDIEKYQNEYNEAVAEFGANSEEASAAFGKLIEAMKRQKEISSDLATISSKLGEIENERAKLLDEMIPEERAVAEAVSRVIEYYYEYIDVLEQMSVLTAKINALNNIRNNIDKIMEERLRHLAEAELRVLEAEEKLYKLRKDEPRRLKSIWDALAKEGLLTDELIDARVNLEKSYGDVMRAQVKYASVLDKLTPDQQRQIDLWLQTALAAMEAGEAIPEMPAFISPADQAIIEDYLNALFAYETAVNNIRDVLSAYVSSLVDAGLASQEVADAFYEWLQLSSQIRVAEGDLDEATTDVRNSIDSIATSIWNLWESLSDEEFSTISEKFMEAARRLGILAWFGDDASEVLQSIRDILDDQTISWSNLTDEQAVAALTLGTLGGEYLKLYDVMSGKKILDLIPGAEDFTEFTTAVKEAFGEAIGYIQDFEKELEVMYLKLHPAEYVNKLENIRDFLENISTALEKRFGKENHLVRFLQGTVIPLYDEEIEKWRGYASGIDDFIEAVRGLKTLIKIPKPKELPSGIYLPPVLITKEDLEKALSSATEEASGVAEESGAKTGENFATSFFQTVIGLITPLLSSAVTSSTAEVGITTAGVVQTNMMPVGDAITNAMAPDSSLLISTVQNTLDAIRDAINTTEIPAIEIPIRVVRTGGGRGRTGGSVREAVEEQLNRWNVPEAVKRSVLRYFQFGGLVSKPTIALMGEKGPELVLPLTKPTIARALLSRYLPEYLPELTAQYGGVYGGSTSVTYTTNTEEFNIMGPITIEHVANWDDFVDKLRMKARVAGSYEL